jgi:hypothetical protein
MAAILSTALGTPSLAETPIQELSAYASSHHDRELGIAPTPLSDEKSLLSAGEQRT